MLSISQVTFRRFLLGAQGLWPGRRFKGIKGTEAALRQMEYLQLDPLNIVARSQDIALHARVLDYKLPHLNKMAYEQRKAFDYGGLLCLYPMDEFPYWQLHMKHRRQQGLSYESFRHPPHALQKKVLDELRTRGALSNREFEGEAVPAWSYRGRKQTSITLYYLWLVGEVMISNRKGFDRVYDLRERVLPAQFDRAASESQAEDYFSRKSIAALGLARENTWRTSLARYLHRDVSRAESLQRVEKLIEKGIVSRVRVDGSNEKYLALNRDLPLLADLEAGRVPRAWSPSGPTTDEEVTLLAPLEIVSARGRAKQIFDYEYLWEVYKPLHQRRWGYYNLPILYKDDLVARLDPKLDRATGTLQILGFWLEDDAPKDAAFADALVNGLTRFAKMTGANRIDVSGVKPVKLRSYLKQKIAF